MFSSVSGMRFKGTSCGSASQLKLAAAADVGAGSEAVLLLAWSDLLDFFAAGFFSRSFASCCRLWS